MTPAKQSLVPPLPPSPVPQSVWLIAASAITLRLVVAALTHFTSEDYLITLRYAENLARGNGLVYNPGERILGTTTPLYTLFLSFAAWLGLPATAVGKAANAAADGALCLLVYQWLARMRQPRAGVIAALWVAANPVQIRWAISGMETSLVTLCGIWAIFEWSRGRLLPSYAALGVLFLLRWDSLLLAAALTVAFTVRDRKVPIRGLLLLIAIALPWLLWAWWYYGNPIPVTGVAKLAVYGWRGQNGQFPQFHNLAYRFYGTPGYAAVSLLALAGLWRAFRQRLWPLAPALVWAAVYTSAILFSKVLLFEWYLVPPLPVYGALAALGVAQIADALAARRPGLVAPAGVGLALAALATGGVMSAVSCRESQSIEDNLRMPLGLWLRDQVKPAERVMLEPIGYIGYYSGHRILDSVGLVSPEVIRFWRTGSTAPMLDIARTFRPEWCVLRPGELKRIEDASRVIGPPWREEYLLVRTVSYSPRRGREPVTFHIFRRR